MREVRTFSSRHTKITEKKMLKNQKKKTKNKTKMQKEVNLYIYMTERKQLPQTRV